MKARIMLINYKKSFRASLARFKLVTVQEDGRRRKKMQIKREREKEKRQEERRQEQAMRRG